MAFEPSVTRVQASRAAGLPLSPSLNFLDLRTYSYGLVVLVMLWLDFVPRFFQGDSASYLQTGHDGWIPPDRSWCFGYLVNYLLRRGQGHSAFILLQCTVFCVLIGVLRIFLWDTRISRRVYIVVAALACLDPVLEVYTRFFMSDFIAVACFIAFLIGLYWLIDPASRGRRVALGLILALAAAIAAVFFRVAYAPIMALAVVAAGLVSLPRLPRRRWPGMMALAAIPVVAVFLLAAANAGVYGTRFQHQMFVNKLSGILLAGVFAPAIQPADFERGSIPITTDDFNRLDLANYDKRNMQVWGQSADELNGWLRARLDVHEDYTDTIDHAASGLVKSAFQRDPLAILAVYATNALDYLRPAEWRKQWAAEIGLANPLPEPFVAYFNSYSALKITPQITQRKSFLIRFYSAVLALYPVQIAAGLGAAVFLLLRERTRPAVVVLCAGLLADLAAAPLYSLYMVPRFILGAILIGYFLLGLVAMSLWQGRASAGQAPL